MSSDIDWPRHKAKARRAQALASWRRRNRRNKPTDQAQTHTRRKR